IFDYAVSKRGASQRKRSGQTAVGGGIAIFIGTIMDAVPESIMIGASLLEEQSVSFLLVIAIFISNIPEGLSSTAGLKNSGYSKTKIMLLWAAVLVISILASWSGFFFLDGASEEIMSAIAAFA
ncbi:ZIP family metal transporter, partial [Clostridium tertium]